MGGLPGPFHQGMELAREAERGAPMGEDLAASAGQMVC